MFGPDHPYGKPAEGYPADGQGLTLDDVKAFHASGFGPKGTTLIVTGDVDPDARDANAGADAGPLAAATTPAHGSRPASRSSRRRA